MNRNERRKNERSLLKGAEKFAQGIVRKGKVTEKQKIEYLALKGADRESLQIGHICALLGYELAFKRLKYEPES